MNDDLCNLCYLGTPHLNSLCVDHPDYEEPEPAEPAVVRPAVRRLSMTYLRVGGMVFAATPAQEERIRALSDQDRQRFLVVLGQLQS